jgi:hypothetical protein
VRAVTILAPRRKRIPFGNGLAVQGAPVQFLLCGVTDTAIDGLNVFGMRQLGAGKIQMTGGT